MKTDFKNKEKETILLLNYGENNKKIFFGKSENLINEINSLKQEIKMLKNKIEELAAQNNLLQEKLLKKQPNEDKRKNQNLIFNKKQSKKLSVELFSLSINRELDPKKIKFLNNIVSKHM